MFVFGSNYAQWNLFMGLKPNERGGSSVAEVLHTRNKSEQTQAGGGSKTKERQFNEEIRENHSFRGLGFVLEVFSRVG